MGRRNHTRSAVEQVANLRREKPHKQGRTWQRVNSTTGSTEFDLGYNDIADSAMQVFAVIQNAAAGSTITKGARA